MQRIMKGAVAITAALLVAAPTAAFATTQQDEAAAEICYEDSTKTEITYALQRSDWVAGVPEVPAVPESYAPQGNYGDTRSAGHYQAESGALHIWTDDASSQAKVAGYLATSIPLASVTSATLDYTLVNGITPGTQLVVDIDGDGAGDGILVGEPVYGGDFWLSNSASAAFKALAPQVGGGFGSENHGLLTEWAAAAPDATVVAVGFSLGSGVHGEGYVNGLVVAGTTYSFVSYNAGTPGVPGVPEHYTDWYEVSTGQGETLPDDRADGEEFQTDALYRYVVTGEVEVPTRTEVECPAQPEPLTGVDYESAPGVCIEPLDGTATVEVYATAWTQAYTWDTDGEAWVLGDKVFERQVFDHAEAVPSDECEPEVVVEPTPDPTPSAEPTPTATPEPTVPPQPTAGEDTLAATGGDNGAVALLTAGALLIAGIAITAVLEIRRRRTDR